MKKIKVKDASIQYDAYNLPIKITFFNGWPLTDLFGLETAYDLPHGIKLAKSEIKDLVKMRRKFSKILTRIANNKIQRTIIGIDRSKLREK